MINFPGSMRQLLRQPVRVLLMLALALGSTLAAAQLTGQTVRAQYYFPDLSTPVSTPVDSIVGAGIEVTGFHADNPIMNIDYSANSILITYNVASSFSSVDFSGIVFSDLNVTIPAITGVTLNAATNMVGLDASRISFTADTVSINFRGLSATDATVVQLDLSFAAAPGGTVAPVPTLSQWTLIVLMLLILAGAGVTVARRRR